MRTSQMQYTIMVDYMEREPTSTGLYQNPNNTYLATCYSHGDLSKPSVGPRGRQSNHNKWEELSLKLNSDGSGDSRSDEKWRKVWSDYKNYTKKKWARITRGVSGTGGGPALNLTLSDLESRVLQIIGVQAATGMAAVEEAGFQSFQNNGNEPNNIQSLVEDTVTEEWNVAGPSTSQSPFISSVAVECPPSPAAIVVEDDEVWRAPPQKRTKGDESTGVAQMFVDAERAASERARERDIAYERLEGERLRLEAERLRVNEYEIRERVRLREQEIAQQGQWLEFMREAMNVIVRYLERGRDA